MGLFSSNDNVKKINEEYIEKELDKNEDLSSWKFDPFLQRDTLGPTWNKPLDVDLQAWPFDFMGNGMDRAWLGWDDSVESKIDGDRIKEEGITGLYNYKIPTDIQFAQCMDSHGLSVWDTNGWWRCLFPENIIRNNLPNLQTAESAMILTKERVETDFSHKFGLYFADYTKYLLWKSQVNKVIQDKKVDQFNKLKEQEQNNKELTLTEQIGQPLTTTPEDFMINNERSKLIEKQKLVVGNSEVFKSNATSQGGSEEIRETKTYFDDGSVVLKTQKKITPRDGGEPRIESHERVLKKGRNYEDSSSGFPFWSRKR